MRGKCECSLLALVTNEEKREREREPGKIEVKEKDAPPVLFLLSRGRFDRVVVTRMGGDFKRHLAPGKECEIELERKLIFLRTHTYTHNTHTNTHIHTH